jgi:hypothetical protein
VRKLSGFILAMLFSVVTLAGPLSAEQAQRFMHHSGMHDMIDQLPVMLQAQLSEQIREAQDSDRRGAVEAALAAAMKDLLGSGIALDYLTTEASAQGMPEILSFLESPLGKRIVAVEKVSSTEQAQAEMSRYATALSQQPPAPARVRLLDELVLALQLDRLMTGMMKGIFQTSSKLAAELHPEKADQMQQFMAAQWTQMEPMVKAQMLRSATLSVYYGYRDVSDQDLIDYTRFMRSPAGQSYVDLSMGVMQRYMDRMLTGILVNLPQH